MKSFNVSAPKVKVPKVSVPNVRLGGGTTTTTKTTMVGNGKLGQNAGSVLDSSSFSSIMNDFISSQNAVDRSINNSSDVVSASVVDEQDKSSMGMKIHTPFGARLNTEKVMREANQDEDKIQEAGNALADTMIAAAQAIASAFIP